MFPGEVGSRSEAAVNLVDDMGGISYSMNNKFIKDKQVGMYKWSSIHKDYKMSTEICNPTLMLAIGTSQNYISVISDIPS
jgi:hypothetical protein